MTLFRYIEDGHSLHLCTTWFFNTCPTVLLLLYSYSNPGFQLAWPEVSSGISFIAALGIHCRLLLLSHMCVDFLLITRAGNRGSESTYVLSQVHFLEVAETQEL